MPTTAPGNASRNIITDKSARPAKTSRPTASPRRLNVRSHGRGEKRLRGLVIARANAGLSIHERFVHTDVPSDRQSVKF